jgi:hypothetical protein
MAAAGVVAALAAAPRAHAQPQAAPPPLPAPPQAAPPQAAPPPLPTPPQPAPPQAAAPQQPAGPWYRFSLADGRVVDGQWVGGDTQSYYVQTASGTFSIARANVVGVVPMTAQAPAPQPPPPAVMAPPPMPVTYAAPPPEDGGNVRRKAQGWGTFALAYGTTALIALGRRDDDPDAMLGLIPIAGPILWTTTDEDEWGKDGWDWLAILSALAQIGGVAGIVQSMGDPPRRSNAMTIAPVTGRQFGGIVLGGRF